jgi:hypothetical protein
MEKNTGSDGLKYLPDHIKWGQWRHRLGISIKNEEAIQKGIEKIYMAIHREHFVSIEPLLDLHDCPDHGIACPGPTRCSYTKNGQTASIDLTHPYDVAKRIKPPSPLFGFPRI